MGGLEGDRRWMDQWYHADKEGMPDFNRPMTGPEMVALYWDLADDNPDILADLYVNFHNFDQVEFLIFKDRLSAAILVANATRRAVNTTKVPLQQQKQDGSHRAPGWEGECDEVLAEQLGVVGSAEEISIGATMVTAVAALESLLKDLLPDEADTRGGLSRLVDAFLTRYPPSREDAQNIRKMVSKVGKRRNAFAHNLTGSYWAVEKADVKFDAATMQDTLFTIGEIAIALEASLPPG